MTALVTAVPYVALHGALITVLKGAVRTCAVLHRGLFVCPSVRVVRCSHGVGSVCDVRSAPSALRLRLKANATDATNIIGLRTTTNHLSALAWISTATSFNSTTVDQETYAPLSLSLALPVPLSLSLSLYPVWAMAARNSVHA